MLENTGQIDHIATDEVVDNLVPPINVSVPQIVEEEPANNLISDDALLGIYSEIMNNIRDDRRQTDEILTNFCEMVMNENQVTGALVEGLVTLVKTKQDSSDKMTKVADLMTRIKLKERDTFPRYLNTYNKQENTLVIEDDNGKMKKELLKKLNSAKKTKPKEIGNA